MIIERLKELGFQAEKVGNRGGKITVKIRTSNGWTYEKFSSSDAIDEVNFWARKHKP